MGRGGTVHCVGNVSGLQRAVRVSEFASRLSCGILFVLPSFLFFTLLRAGSLWMSEHTLTSPTLVECMRCVKQRTLGGCSPFCTLPVLRYCKWAMNDCKQSL